VLLLVSFTPPALAEVVSGRVVDVSDGDTITVIDDAKTQHRVRFSGIEAPVKGQAFGDRSKENLS
jgi:endonuclease YncB( thermonuclease family)